MTIRSGFKVIRAHCVGHRRDGWRCDHYGDVPLEAVPRKLWQEVGPHFRCTECGSVGYVDLRVDWAELIDFSKPSNH